MNKEEVLEIYAKALGQQARERDEPTILAFAAALEAKWFGEPVAWMWDEATYTESDVRGRCWQHKVLGTQKPNTSWMQRNVTALYTKPNAAQEQKNES